MITDTIDSIFLDKFLDDLNELLIMEKIIEIKKENNIELTKEEKFFDLYIIKPSFLLKHLKKDD